MPFYIAIVFLINLLIEFYLYDKLLQYQYINYYYHWVEDGKPIGVLFWEPNGEIIPLKSRLGFTRNVLSKWIYITPNWLKNDSDGKRILYLYRISSLLLIIAFLYTFIFIIIYGKNGFISGAEGDALYIFTFAVPTLHDKENGALP